MNYLEESILYTIKKCLGLDKSYDAFDMDVIVAINSAIMALTQNGIGPQNGFMISGPGEAWEDFLGEDVEDLEAAKTYIYVKARLIFDPPSSATVIEALNKVAAECEWRLRVQREGV